MFLVARLYSYVHMKFHAKIFETEKEIKKYKKLSYFFTHPLNVYYLLESVQHYDILTNLILFVNLTSNICSKF